MLRVLFVLLKKRHNKSSRPNKIHARNLILAIKTKKSNTVVGSNTEYGPINICTGHESVMQPKLKYAGCFI